MITPKETDQPVGDASATPKVGVLTALVRFFLLPGEDKLAFGRKVKNDMTETERLELAQGAARELGLSQDQCGFALA